MAQDSKQFTIELVHRSHQWAKEYVAREYGRIRNRMEKEGLIEWCRSFMWREYMVGCHVPAKVLSLLPDDAQDLKFLLTTQILDEWKHYRVFSERVKALGGDGELAHYEPSVGDWELYYGTYRWEHPVELATALNCTGEVMLTVLFKTLIDPKHLLVDEETARIIRDQILEEEPLPEGGLVDPETARILMEEVIPDEGRHIRIGRLILERYATTDELQERALRVQASKMGSLQVSHGHLVTRVLGQ